MGIFDAWIDPEASVLVSVSMRGASGISGMVKDSGHTNPKLKINYRSRADRDTTHHERELT